MRNRWCSRLPWGLALGLALIAGPMPAWSADVHVDSTTDALDVLPGDGICATATGSCTLRAAIQETNALPGADTIILPAGTYLLTLGSGDLDSSGDLDVRDTLAIQGAGAAITVIDANHASRAIEVADSPGLPLALSGVTVQNGNGFAVSGETFGGGIAGLHGLSLVRTTVSGNTATTAAGGLATVDGTISDSTFTGNTAPPPQPLGGSDILTNGAGTLTIVNSTFDGEIRNLAYCDPPGIPTCVPGTDIVLANVTVDTISFLQAGPGGSFTARNSIIRTCRSGLTLTSQGHNLIETNACNVVGSMTGNLIGVDPRLGPLADNGGPTATHEPLADSPVLDAGDPGVPGSGGTACEATDQRAIARPQGPRCDIGAVERLACPPCLVADGAACVPPSCAVIPTMNATLSLTRGTTPAKDRLSYRWRGGPVAKSDFGDPRVVTPRLCLYDAGGNVLLDASAPEDGCHGHACWRESTSGYRYRDADLTPSGIASLSLEAGAVGSVSAKSRGALLAPKPSPFTTPVRALLFGGPSGACLGTDFGTGIRKNTDRSFRAVAP